MTTTPLRCFLCGPIRLKVHNIHLGEVSGSFKIATDELPESLYICISLNETSAFQSTDHLPAITARKFELFASPNHKPPFDPGTLLKYLN